MIIYERVVILSHKKEHDSLNELTRTKISYGRIDRKKMVKKSMAKFNYS